MCNDDYEKYEDAKRAMTNFYEKLLALKDEEINRLRRIAMWGWRLLMLTFLFCTLFILFNSKAFGANSKITKLEQCYVDYYFCAGRIVAAQANYDAAVLMVNTCSERNEELAEYLDLRSLPKFTNVSLCQQHLGACGYYLVYWENLLKQKYSEVRNVCK